MMVDGKPMKVEDLDYDACNELLQDLRAERMKVKALMQAVARRRDALHVENELRKKAKELGADPASVQVLKPEGKESGAKVGVPGK